MKRFITERLLAWKRDPRRRVLLVRGARQVGKTYSVRELGRTFDHFVEVNFEEHPGIHVFFRDSLTPSRIVEKLSAYFGIPIVPDRTLLFFDEIQACPEAVSSLRFFHEQLPRLHVIAAGSLLELALAALPSMGVGRLTTLFMFPLSFAEVLLALGEETLLKLSEQASAEQPLDEPFHRRLVDHVRTYLLIGGMPAVVSTYADSRQLPVCFKILDDLITTFEDDFAKYKKRAPVSRLREVFHAIGRQAGGKFVYARVPSSSSAPMIRDALDLLVQAGLAYRVLHTHARGLPLGAQVDEKKFKVLLFDVGIHQRLLGLDIPGTLTATDIELINRGVMAEVFTGLELIAHHPPHVRPALYYWHREAHASNAEVDYVVQQGTQIVPIEVKAGTKGQMQSLYLFLEERNLSRGLRVSLERFARYERRYDQRCVQIEAIPLYAASRLVSG